jgi:hypothetical protein
MSQRYGNKSALKHGAFTEVVILPGEDPNELKELRAALYDEWNPEGPTEIDKVESIAMGMWRKRRFQRYLQKTLGKAVGILDAFLRNDRADYDRLVSVLEHIESGTLTEDNFSDKLPERWADEITKKSPRNRYDNDAAWLCAVSEIIYEILNSLIMIQDGTATLSYEMAIDRFADSEQSVNERIDAKIDKDIKALGQIKTMKAIGIGQRRAPTTTEPMQQIESSTIQIVETD